MVFSESIRGAFRDTCLSRQTTTNGKEEELSVAEERDSGVGGRLSVPPAAGLPFTRSGEGRGPVGPPWGLHGASVGPPWGLRGASVGPPWGLRGASMGPPWGLHAGPSVYFKHQT
ncbi:hypothetical protein EYF80_060702 [Liparis tanakae]|uniref:Uncharacterized protein n=1 Tax=Liparis tanakae TaxID=230148 RepID=A0A4Z2EKP3_9TELE|nr:hypothetical protein EYF80_060702 [Liparis tanakae]